MADGKSSLELLANDLSESDAWKGFARAVKVALVGGWRVAFRGTESKDGSVGARD